ncbi:MAG: SDR family oxidoreductase [Myxococcales bacterium]
MATDLKPINEQVMVITGASSGIGLATAKLAAERGAKLVLAARSEQTLESIVEQLHELGADAVHVVADVADREQVERVAREAIATFGRIDTWVNNAGVSIYGRIKEIHEEDNRRLFDVNFWGVVNGSLVALEHLSEHGGALINIGSEVSDAVVPLQGMYTASKHAVKGFTDALRIEIEKVDQAPVSITLIQPTAVNTPYPQHARNYMDREPKLPDPKIEPFTVAEAVLRAACHHTRDVTVGAMAMLTTAASKLMPGVADLLATQQTYRQQYPELPREPDGTLYRPGESGQTHGARPRIVPCY